MTDERITAYLLGELSAEESERFEDECFAAEDWPAQVELVEEDLVDDYLRGELTPAQRRRFEENYLTTTARVERVRMAAALLGRMGEWPKTLPEPDPDPVKPAAPASPAVPTLGERFRAFWGGRVWAPAAALAVVAVVAGALLIPRLRQPPTFATLTLAPAASERAEGARPAGVKLPADASGLKLSLLLPAGADPAARYRAELESDAGGSRPLQAVGPEGGVVSVVVPAESLRRGAYVIKLFAAPPSGPERRLPGSYFFNVE
jgi:anti-sigma factor RsiW